MCVFFFSSPFFIDSKQYLRTRGKEFQGFEEVVVKGLMYGAQAEAEAGAGGGAAGQPSVCLTHSSPPLRFAM